MDKRESGRRKVERRREVAAQIAAPSRLSRGLTSIDRYSVWIALALVALATLRIASTYTVFNHTFDEPAHIACGMEWLDEGRYTLEPQHPPLSRVAMAIGPFLAGARSPGTNGATELWHKGLAILYTGNRYDAMLTFARLGNLPFFWVACAVVYLWGRRYFNRVTAVFAVLLFTFLPPVLAHAGLATTDMALTAFLSAAFLAGHVWLEEPTLTHAVWFGVCAGLMVLSKFSCVVFFPAGAALALAWHLAVARPGVARLLKDARERVRSLALAIGVAFVLIWSMYRFSFGRVDMLGFRVPAPELFSGMGVVWLHNAMGHPTYLLGTRGHSGFWCFYEVALAVKTPLGFLALLCAGIWIAARGGARYRAVWPALLFSAGILVVGAFSHINIGIRHVLPIYAGFSIVAAVALSSALENQRAERWMPWAAGAMTAWMALSSGLSHPDYLAYFNELGGPHPENILVDSDLDWGQDLKRLAARLQAAGAHEVVFFPFNIADLDKFGFPPVGATDPLAPSPGWNAVSKSYWKLYRLGLVDAHPEWTPWPDRVPRQEEVGKSYLLYYFPPAK